MDRYSSPFIGQNGYGKGQSPGTINLAQAGTHTLAPDLANIASNTPLVQRNLVPFLIEPPRFFEFLPNRDLAVRCLKAFIEKHTRTINGLNQQISVDTADNAYGGSGEVIKVATNVTRAQSNPTFGGWELQGRAVTRYIKWWIQYGIGDENTKIPLVVSDGNVAAADYDASFYGATILFVEPDASFTEPVSAWLGTNMFPLATPPWEGRKDAGQLGQNLEFDIEFSMVSDVSVGTMIFAREMMRSLNLRGMNPNDRRLWFTGVSADVAAAKNGLQQQLVEGAAARQNIG
jgi:hypothetical protein